MTVAKSCLVSGDQGSPNGSARLPPILNPQNCHLHWSPPGHSQEGYPVTIVKRQGNECVGESWKGKWFGSSGCSSKVKILVSLVFWVLRGRIQCNVRVDRSRCRA